jgi:hypothetical protein
MRSPQHAHACAPASFPVTCCAGPGRRRPASSRPAGRGQHRGRGRRASPPGAPVDHPGKHCPLPHASLALPAMSHPVVSGGSVPSGTPTWATGRVWCISPAPAVARHCSPVPQRAVFVGPFPTHAAASPSLSPMHAPGRSPRGPPVGAAAGRRSSGRCGGRGGSRGCCRPRAQQRGAGLATRVGHGVREGRGDASALATAATPAAAAATTG